MNMCHLTCKYQKGIIWHMAVVLRLHIFEQSSIPPISKFTNILYYQSNASITLQWQKNAENVMTKSNIISCSIDDIN